MQPKPESDAPMSLDHSRLRSRGGCLFLGLPLILIPVVIGGYAFVFGMGMRGRAPMGPVMAMQYQGCESASDAVLARVTDMGLGEPEATLTEAGFTIQARMPADRRVAARIPTELVEVGSFELRAGGPDGERLAGPEHIESVFPRLTGDGSAITVVSLQAELGGSIQRRQMDDPEGELVVLVDGVEIVRLSNGAPVTGAEIEIEPEPEQTRAAVERAASRAIAMDHPLPCTIVLTDVVEVAPAIGS